MVLDNIGWIEENGKHLTYIVPTYITYIVFSLLRYTALNFNLSLLINWRLKKKERRKNAFNSSKIDWQFCNLPMRKY